MKAPRISSACLALILGLTHAVAQGDASVDASVDVPPAEVSAHQVEQNRAELETGKPVIGMGFVKWGKGVFVRGVVSGSAAERAGLDVGMVITHLGNIRLMELDKDQILAVFQAAENDMVFTLEDGTQVALTKTPLKPGGE